MGSTLETVILIKYAKYIMWIWIFTTAKSGQMTPLIVSRGQALNICACVAECYGERLRWCGSVHKYFRGICPCGAGHTVTVVPEASAQPCEMSVPTVLI